MTEAGRLDRALEAAAPLLAAARQAVPGELREAVASLGLHWVLEWRQGVGAVARVVGGPVNVAVRSWAHPPADLEQACGDLVAAALNAADVALAHRAAAAVDRGAAYLVLLDDLDRVAVVGVAAPCATLEDGIEIGRLVPAGSRC